MNHCSLEKWKNCIEVEEIVDASQILENNLGMHDDQGNLLESQGMFRLKWLAKCDSCFQFSADWLLTREEFEGLGFNFYSYNDQAQNWNAMSQKRITKVTINGQIFYRIKLTCGDFGVLLNGDFKPKRPLVKIKNHTSWEIETYQSDSLQRSFFALEYDTTENIERKKVWKVPPNKSTLVGIRNKKTGEFLLIPLLMLKPARLKLFSHRLTLTHGKNGNYSVSSGWPHMKTAKVMIDEKKHKYYYRKYKITRKTIRRAIRANSN
jgi:hypothetical protein